jgi:PAS domain S-box-containing protein
MGRAPYALYYLAVLVTAWFCGVGPTLVAILLSALSAWTFIVPGTEPGYLATIPVFLVVSGAMLVMARAVRRIQEETAYHSAVIESSNDAVITKDLNAVIRSWNAAAERIFGYTAAEAVGRPVTILIPPEQWAEEENILAHIRTATRIEHFETVRRAKNGNSIDVSLTISPIRDGFGTVIGASTIARDITERKRTMAALDAQREWINRTMESIGDAVIATDAEGKISFMNPIAERLTGWSGVEAKGHDCEDVFHIVQESTRNVVESPVRRVLRDGTVVGLANSTILIAKDGTERPIDDSGAPIRSNDGRVLGVVMVFRDISERRHSETERLTANTEREHLLERERAARSEAEAASRSKDEFVAMVSHELRTPLNAILGWTEILAHSLNDPETAKRGVEVIARNARAQQHLISDLLDMSRIISSKLRLDVRDIDLIAVIRSAIETIRPAADARGIAIESTLDPSVALTTGDAGRLEQCVWNFLSNAIKFTPQGGAVTVTLGRSDSHVEITVSDNGIGIRPEFLPHVFERFKQAEAGERRSTGLGLGLAIVKQIVELHGGTVRADSAGEGQGATFSIVLPVRALRASTAPPSPGPERRGSLKGLTVLLVEDDADNREILKALLETHHAEVWPATSAAQALEILEQQRPSILVSDIGLPEMDGYGLIRRIRATSGAERIPAIALTAHASATDRTKAMRAGYQAHIAKPVEPAELVATVAALTQLVSDDEELPYSRVESQK